MQDIIIIVIIKCLNCCFNSVTFQLKNAQYLHALTHQPTSSLLPPSTTFPKAWLCELMISLMDISVFRLEAFYLAAAPILLQGNVSSPLSWTMCFG